MIIKWTKPAADDLDSIYKYIARDSEFYAACFIEKILKTVEILEFNPEIGRKVPEADNKTIKELLFQNYRIIYRLVKNEIQIIAVIRGSRDIANFTHKPWEIF